MSFSKTRYLFIFALALQACEQKQFFNELPRAGGGGIAATSRKGGDLALRSSFQACPKARMITAELRSVSGPSRSLVDSAVGLGGGFNTTYIHFDKAEDGVPYYLVIKSSNSLETWSAQAITFQSHSASYDFTTNIAKAMGSNMSSRDGVSKIYDGDVNQDGLINDVDVALIHDQEVAFTTTAVTDLNCDGYTNLEDTLIAYNNSVINCQVVRARE